MHALRRRTVLALAGVAMLGTSALLSGQIEAAISSLNDGFSSFNSTIWDKSTGYSNGGTFNVGWKSDHVKYADGKMYLQLDNVPSSGKPYTSGEIHTKDVAHYGSYRVRMKPAEGSGTVSSYFTYAKSGNAEVDIEFLGRDTTKVHLNYWTNGVGEHETIIPLGFDAKNAYHEYRFDWAPGYIKWYVDGRLIHTETGARGPLPTEPGPIYMNLWTGASAWTGPFNWNGTAKKAFYDYVRYTAF